MSINTAVLTLLKQAVASWGPRPVVVASGRNFEIEEELVDTASDVIAWGSTLYEWAYGMYLTDKEFELRWNPDYLLRLPFLPNMPKKPLNKIALLVMSPMIRDAYAAEDKAIALESQWREIFERTQDYVSNRHIRLMAAWPFDANKSPSMFLKAPAYVHIPQQAVVAADQVFYSPDYRAAIANERFDEIAVSTTANAHPFFLVSNEERPPLEDKLIGRLMLGGDSRWVYSSHGSPIVLREDKPVGRSYRPWQPTGGHWICQIEQVPTSIYKQHYDLYGKKTLLGDKVSGSANYFLIINGDLVGGWSVRLSATRGIIAEVVRLFHVGEPSFDELVQAAAASSDARLLYESKFGTRVEGIHMNMQTFMYEHPVAPLDFHLENWRAEYSTDARDTDRAD